MSDSFKLRKIIYALNQLGFVVVRQKGSHMLFEHKDGRITVVPAHKEIRVGLLIKIAKDIGMEKEEFFSLIKK